MCDTNSEWELLTFNVFLCGRLIMTFSLVTEISTSQHQNPLFGDNGPFSAIREASVSQAQGHSVSRLNTFIFDIFRTGTNGQNGHLVQVFTWPQENEPHQGLFFTEVYLHVRPAVEGTLGTFSISRTAQSSKWSQWE